MPWSERQGALLRRRAAGKVVNEAELDWPHIAQETESMGRAEQVETRHHALTHAP